MSHHDRARPAVTVRPRRLATLMMIILLTAACGADPGPAPTGPAPTPTPAARVSESATPEGAASTPTTSSVPSSPRTAERRELPRGGTSVFPRYRLVGYAGLTGASALGRLGIGDVGDRMDELEKLAKPYAQGREVLPVMEIIATIVRSSPGDDGLYRTRASDETIARYLKEARAHRALLLLNIQPGRAEFFDEVKAYDRWLAEPDVGLALDPEWAMGPHQVPGGAFGHTTGTVLDQVAVHVSTIVAKHHLPEKVLVYHQLTPGIVTKEKKLRDRSGVVLIKSIDGIGHRLDKIATYRRVIANTPSFVHPGFKLFFEEDRRSGPLMTPKQVLQLKPQPDYVMYE